jgi:hypothetical protein
MPTMIGVRCIQWRTRINPHSGLHTQTHYLSFTLYLWHGFISGILLSHIQQYEYTYTG